MRQIALNSNLSNACQWRPTAAFVTCLTLLFSAVLQGASYPPSSVGGGFEVEDLPETLQFDNLTYDANIATVQLFPSGSQLSEPYLLLGLDAQLELHFDDLTADYRDLYFTVIHCTHDWKPSDLDQSAYMTGFSEQSISSIEDSFNTFQTYTHCSATFPNDMAGLTLSGNYLLVVYENGNLDELILSRRFVVYEQQVTIETRVHEATAVEDSRYMQELDFTVYHAEYDIVNPYTDFHVTLLQNNRWNTAITDLQPRFVKGDELSYDYSRENNFEGGNEWRAVDTKQLDFITYEVDSIGIVDHQVHCWVKPFGRRSFKQYRSRQDLEGKFFVKNDEAGDSNLEAEYIWHHFILPYDFKIDNTEVYVFGDVSEFRCKEKFKMTYDFTKQAYTLDVKIKQGYLNYQYAVLENGTLTPDLAYLEGSHRQTHNIYSVFAYNWDPTLGYDRVVGAAFTNTFNR